MNEILIVDDSSLNRMSLSQILQDEYKIITASSGKDMFHVLEETDPKLILLDVIMPDMDGFEVIAKLKSSEEYNKIPVIFITGLDDAANEEKGFQLGAIDYITKPFKPNVVKARVKSYVQLYEFLRQAEMLGQNDGLTGLYNKKMTEKQIKKQLLAEPPLKSGALMVIDVDNFKSINDTFGHLYGDAVITQLGSSLRQIFQKSDILGRIGGDEFFVFLRNYNDPTILIKRAEEVCENFRKNFEQNGATVSVSASIGIATTDFSRDFEEMYKFADIALYSTKSRGKNGYTFYSGQELVAYKSQRTEIENTKLNHNDPVENIKGFKDNLKEYMFNLVEGSKVYEYTIQSILQMICDRFSFDRAYISKLDFEETRIICTNDWISSDVSHTPSLSLLSFIEMLSLNDLFPSNNLLVSKALNHKHKFSPVQDDNKDIVVFSLKNKKALLGYIAFEKISDDKEFNPKVINNIIDVCQQLSTVIINQFLIESVRESKDNLTAILDNITKPIYITKPEASKPLFVNKAAKDSNIAMHSKSCFKPSSDCKNCILKNAMTNNGYFEDDIAVCKEIEWSHGSKAYMITYK